MKRSALTRYKSTVFAFILFTLIALLLPLDDICAASKPNVIVIYADDLGYGDLACFGHPTIKTPGLDRMAAEGMKFTQFYSAAPVCTPSRAALLTGRYPIRSGMCSDKRRVLFPNSGGGIPASEVTLAEALKATGYQTACVGKWHLGHLPPFLPTGNGFDSYLGIPYSNDMDRVADRKLGRSIFLKPEVKYWNVPLMRDTKVIEQPADQTTITKRYTEETIRLIRQNKQQPFFIYLAHSMPHVPLFRSQEFQDKSRRGLYGDVIEEIDWSVGQILEELKSQGLDQNTIVWFSSDNGPWLIFDQQGGSAGLLRDGKGSTWEGGMREPTLAWWPGHIPAGSVSQELGSTMDIYTTSIKLAGGTVPTDRVVDGVDLTSVLLEEGNSPRDEMVYYRGTKLMAIRKGPWKAHFITKPAYGREPFQEHDPPVLYHLEHDPSEKYDVAKDHPDVIKTLKAAAEQHRKTVKPVVSQLEIPLPE
ncbi:sulfatase [Gimesia sp.]|uniref:sulfatase family protein n=1 Tax=Gimesia sp. TaxID=2024833 RepID=UPI003A8D0D18